MEDVTYRVVRTLGEVGLIAAEDTRNSARLLGRYGIKTPMTSYHEHNKYDKAYELAEKLRGGMDVALITDAGTPGISDPGEELVRICLEQGIPVTSLPGPSACVTALSMSGLPSRRFAFEAFLPRENREREQILSQLKNETRTIVLYESPHHLEQTLRDLYGALGDREIAVARELTKVHEEVERTTLGECLCRCEGIEPRGEYVLVIEGRPPEELRGEEREAWGRLSVPEHVALYEEEGFPRKEAMRLAARDRGVSRRDIYQEMLRGGATF